MEQEKNPSMFRGVLMYGLIVGLASVVVSLILYFMDLSLETWTSIVSLVVFVGMMVLVLVMYKNEYGKGFISYGRVVLIGFLVAIVAGVISVVQAYAVFQFDESYLQDTKYFAIEQINERMDKMDMRYQERLSDDDYAIFEERMEDARDQAIDKIKDRSAFAFSFPLIFNSIFIGVLTALITGIFIKKNPPSEPEVVT